MKRVTCFLLAFISFWVLGNQALAVTDEQLGNKADSIEKKAKTEKKEKTEQSSKDTEKSDEQKKRDENYTVHKTGEGHGGVPTSGGFKP